MSIIDKLRSEQTDGWSGDACAVSCDIANEAAETIEVLLTALFAAYDFIMKEYACAEASALDGDPLAKGARPVRDEIVAAIVRTRAA